MTVIRANFKNGRIMKAHETDGKTCLNCLEHHDGYNAKPICLNCIRFGHTDGIADNWQPQGKSNDTATN